MDKKHTWLKAVGKTKYVRILAAMLALCVLFTALPELPASLFVFAAEEETKETENKDIPADDEKLSGGGLNDNAEEEEGDEPSDSKQKNTEGDGTSDNGPDDREKDKPSDSEQDDKEKGDGTDKQPGESTPPKEQEETEDSEEDEEITAAKDEETADAEIVENAADAVVQALLVRIDALPDAEESLAAEPDIDDGEGDEEDYEEACTAWMEELYEYAEEAFAIMEEYEALTEEQQAQIPGEAVAKLMAWVELAEVISGGQETYAEDVFNGNGNCGAAGYETAVKWKVFGSELKISGTGAMADYDKASDLPWANKNFSKITIGNGITHIGKKAFVTGRSINQVSQIEIPKSVSSIGTGAFSGCTGLSIIACSWEKEDNIPELSEGLFPDKEFRISIPGNGYCDHLRAYLSVPGWLAYKDKLTVQLIHKSIEKIEAKDPTCMEPGHMEYWQCQTCEELFKDDAAKTPTTPDAVTLPVNPDNHSYTYTASGAVITESCANGCGHSATATLSVKSGADLTYTGSEVKPVTVTYSDGWAGTGLQKPDDSKMIYTNNTNVGTAAAKLTIREATAQISFTIAPPPHVHSGGMTFDKELPAAGGELASGNYYLAGDVEDYYTKIQSGVEVNLCLNGHTLNGLGSYTTIELRGGTLNIYDCNACGVLSGDNKTGTSASYAVDMDGGMFNLYGGKITRSDGVVIYKSSTDATINLFGGIVEGGGTSTIRNGGTLVIGGNSVVRSNGGYAVNNNSSTAVLKVKDTASLSGVKKGIWNIRGTVNIEGGIITGTGVDGYGIENRDTLNITGGTVTGDKYGVYMFSDAASLNLSGSPAVSGQTADLYLQTGRNVTLENAKVDATGYTGDALTVIEASTSGKAGSYAIKTGEENKDKFTLTETDGKWWYSYKDGGLYLDDHIHSYTYTANGAVITESCTCGHEETATLSLQSIADMTYTGSALKPVTVTYSDGWAGTGTKKPDNSQITYTNNTNAGTATAKLKIGTATASFNFTISARSIGGATITLASATLTYNGQEQTKGVSSVKVNGRTLTAGTDYTVSGSTGKNAGEYIITVTGKGNYSGTKNDTFQIMQKTLTDDMVTIAPGPHYYTGNAITPVVTVLLSGITLPDTDYTVSYADHVNPGTAAVTVMGKESGNCVGMVSKTFTIGCRPLPSGKNLADYVTISPSPNDEDWYSSNITLTPKDGGSVGETFASMGDSVVISEETGADGGTKTVYIKDGGGNIYQTQFHYKLDQTPPVIDLTGMSVENGIRGLWNGIIGKKSMIIKIPAEDITDALSGIEKVTYETEPDSGTGRSGTLNIKDGHYEIALNAEFSGTIRLTAGDRAGNTAQVSLTADGGKVIAEDYAPVVTITVPDTPQPSAGGWYNTAVTLTVTVTDDKDSGDNSITSGGIAGIKWKDGENGTEQTVAGLPGASPVYEKEFTITAGTDGTHTYYVQATDNAGNESGWQTVTVRLDTGSPTFSGNVGVTNRTQEGADIAFTPSEGGKAYWIVSNTGTAPDAQTVVAGAQGGAGKGGVQDVTGGGAAGITVTGLTPGEKHTVYVVLEDAAGNLSVVKEVSFTTLQKAPEIALDDLTIDHGKETVKLPANVGNAEVYTNPNDPSGSKIQPEADGSLPVKPGTPVYIRYPEKTEGGETTPASGAVKIDIPGRPAAPAPKRTKVTDTTVTVTNPAAGEEYILVEKGSLPAGTEPDWNDADKVSETGTFTELEPNKEYELYVRKKATEDDFASESAKTEVRTAVTIEEPVVTGEGAGQPGNTALGPDAPDGNGGTVTFTGTYGEEYTPVIKVGGKEIVPGAGTPGSKMVWDENSGNGKWEYPCEVPDDASNLQIAVEFRRRTVTGIAAEPENLAIFADDAANRDAAEAGNMEPLTVYMKDRCSVQTAYDNGTKGTLQESAVFATADSFVPKGAAYRYSVSAGEKTCTAALTVQPVNASSQSPDALTKKRKNSGYTAQEVSAWLPAQVTAAYTGTGYTERTDSLAVTWDTGSLGEDFGGTVGEKTINGTVKLPAWATGQDSVSIVIRFENKKSPSGGNSGSDNNGGNNGDTNENGGSENNGNDGGNGGDGNGNGENSDGSIAPGKGNAHGKTAIAAPVNTSQPTTRTNPPGQPQPTAVRNDSGRTEDSNRENETASAQGQPETAGQQDGQARQETAGADSGGQAADAAARAIAASVDSGRIVLSGVPVATGNVEGMIAASTALDLGSGAVVVTVVCAEQAYTAGVADTAAVANAVLTSEQLTLVNSGETIEIRIDVTDISEQVPAQDKQVIESGMEAYREEMPGLVLGMYVDISMFIKVGTGEWNVISETSEPVEVVVGIPEQLQGDGREFTIIRAHNGEYTVMNDLDDAPDTITVSTELFSSYAIAYVEAGQSGDGAKCGLCHICPTFLGICCFIWLILIAAAVIVMIALVKRRFS